MRHGRHLSKSKTQIKQRSKGKNELEVSQSKRTQIADETGWPVGVMEISEAPLQTFSWQTLCTEL